MQHAVFDKQVQQGLSKSAGPSEPFASQLKSECLEEAQSIMHTACSRLRIECAKELESNLQALASRLRGECLEEVQSDLDVLRDGLTKVVEAVQQERRSRVEGHCRLREDCREAIQKEVNARLERDSKMREDIEAEARLRQEAVEVIQLAIEECRVGLETHTHELQICDSQPSGTTTGVAVLPGH